MEVSDREKGAGKLLEEIMTEYRNGYADIRRKDFKANTKNITRNRANLQ